MTREVRGWLLVCRGGSTPAGAARRGLLSTSGVGSKQRLEAHVIFSVRRVMPRPKSPFEFVSSASSLGTSRTLMRERCDVTIRQGSRPSRLGWVSTSSSSTKRDAGARPAPGQVPCCTRRPLSSTAVSECIGRVVRDHDRWQVQLHEGAREERAHVACNEFSTRKPLRLEGLGGVIGACFTSSSLELSADSLADPTG